MCLLNNSKCLCHHIKKFIVADENKKFFKFFTSINITELYSFLKDAYQLLDDTASVSFNDDLNRLVAEYVKPPETLDDERQVINVNNEERRLSFLKVYAKYTKGKVDKEKLVTELNKLVQDVEKLTYNNLCDNKSFIETLKRNSKVFGRKSSVSNLAASRLRLGGKNQEIHKKEDTEPDNGGNSATPTW
ncbi:hypothetical protein [Legionella cardiaca]|uniref:Uncharacterized protein n=1 Tax=Legionella cardiaca TaxID=1071983 RepID=A0ABY8AT56_9GAMM|nr:hypothetical protein [Legionella cardiaca]WED43664.1 hypothetical protein PXX05_02490 [Legionella cardiaca]